jgi:hypothetical protein
MPRFTADTPEISDAGGRLSGLADQLSAARSAMARLEPAGHAADNSLVFLAFTDLDALRAWDPEVREWAVMIGRDLAAAALEWDAARVAVNPSGPAPGDVLPADLAWVASGEALRAGADGIESLRELYLVEDGRTGNPVVGMVVEPRSEAAAAAAVLGELVRPHVPAGEPLDLVVLDEARRAEVARLVDPIG